MNSLGYKLLKSVMTWGICGLSVASATWAATTTMAGITTRVSANSYTLRPRGSIKSASDRQDLPRLDLSPPTRLSTPSGVTSTSLGFPSARRLPASAKYEDQLPALGAGDEPAARTMSGTEAFTRRLHREGIPIVRLWEGHTAFLSLGLNQRGKPGLWLIQKVR